MGNEGEEVFQWLSEHGLDSPQADKCGELLTLMLTRCWPQPQGGISRSSKTSLRHVLTWRLWPCFFRRFGNNFVHESQAVSFRFDSVRALSRFIITCSGHSTASTFVSFLNIISSARQTSKVKTDSGNRFLSIHGSTPKVNK